MEAVLSSVRLAGGALSVGNCRRQGGPPAAVSPQRCQPRSTRFGLCVMAGKRISEADLYQAVPPPGQQLLQKPAGLPWYAAAPVAVVGLFAGLRILKAVKRRMSGGSRLEERGFKKGGVADDRAYTNAIKSMRKVQYDELSEEQILAARRRRQQEVQKDAAPLDLDAIELPENHPFAVKKKLAPEEEALQRSRLSARRGLSEEDMRRLREQQALADQMEAEEEARQAARRRQGDH